MNLVTAMRYLKYKIENNLVISRHNPKDYEAIEKILRALQRYIILTKENLEEDINKCNRCILKSELQQLKKIQYLKRR